MSIVLKNTEFNELKVFIEPSTDEILLKKNDALAIQLKGQDSVPLEIHYCEDAMVVWIPHGQSADFYINGEEIETMCSQYFW